MKTLNLNFLKYFKYKKANSLITHEEKEYNDLNEIVKDSNLFYIREDLVYFPKLEVYGAFKYDVVKDILANSKTITVSDVHIALNSTYFSLDEKKHQYNKKLAYKHLAFLSKSLQNEPNEFTENLFDFLISKLPEKSEFDLSEYLINPFVFLNILKEYGFLELMKQFNPWSNFYNHDVAIELINSYFEDSSLLNILLNDYILDKGEVPRHMQDFISEIKSDKELNEEHIAQFFASMIFSGTHSTASFLSSFIHTVFTKYPHLLDTVQEVNQLEILANEILRINMPVQWIYRTVREDTNYADKKLKVGDTVILFVGVANTDPSIFEDPNEIKFDRVTNHLSFGLGAYACIGKFATLRTAMNLISYLSKVKNQIKFKDNLAKHTIHNAILKIPLVVNYIKK